MTSPLDSEDLCSARGCQQPAAYELLWRNPKIHTADRVKRWLACEDHRETLSDFLARRDFPLRVEKLTPDH
ncbi:MAG TPA: hypothetical protein VLM05_02895 [Mycobacteriales bacterium]|nr:hypothetical protein [Mycobacteriales bacterium]